MRIPYGQLVKNFQDSLGLAFDTHTNLMNLTAPTINALVNSQNTVVPQGDKYHAKTLYRFSKLTDKLLRKIENSAEANNELQEVLEKGLKSLKKAGGDDRNQLARMTVQNGLQAINLGYFRASDMIPRLLDIVSKATSKVVEEEFK